MPTSCNSANKIGRLTRRGIAKLSLVVLTVTIASAVPPESVAAQDNNLVATASKELPIVKSATLGTRMNVPWSQPVRILDPFEGNYVGVFDRNYFYRRFLNENTRFEAISLWSPDSVRFLLAYRDRDCSPGYDFYHFGSLGARCGYFNSRTLNVTDLLIKVDKQVFRLEGENGSFPVSQELAAALKNSTPEQNVSIRLLAETGVAIDSEIGKGTVKAWKAIY